MPGSSYEFHGIGHGVMARRSATESAAKDGLYPRINSLPPYIEHPLRNHGLVGNFHIIGTIYGVFNIRVMGL